MLIRSVSHLDIESKTLSNSTTVDVFRPKLSSNASTSIAEKLLSMQFLRLHHRDHFKVKQYDCRDRKGSAMQLVYRVIFLEENHLRTG